MQRRSVFVVVVSGLLALQGLTALPAAAADVTVPAAAETTAVPSASDAADDTAIWIHPSDPSQSVVIGTDKLTTGGLGVWDLQGDLVHWYAHGSMNNVDLRYNFPLGSERVALVGVTDRNETSTGARFYKVNPADRSLTLVGRIDTTGRPRGFAMYHSPDSGRYYALIHDFHTNVISQWELNGTSGTVTGTMVRSFDNGDSSEGIIADDELKRIYVAEENVALWRYGAEPGDGSARTAVDTIAASGGHIVDNIKNPTIYYGRNGTGYLIVSSQGGSNFVIYNRGDNAFVGSFKIGTGPTGVDGVSGQDGADVTNFGLGSAFPNGLFTAQDHVNSDAGNGRSGNQNYKYVSWTDIANAFTPKLLIDPLFDPRQIGAPGTGGNDTTPPSTTIDSGPSGPTGSTTATFVFSANEPSTFECSLDAGAYASCTSPRTLTGLGAGEHTFSVRATDAAGNTDGTPATRSWTVDPSASVTTTFGAEADAAVQSGTPSTNLGTSVKLLADTSPAEESYLRFSVAGLPGAVQGAKLRLYATNGSTNGPAVYGTGTAWDEAAITWASGRPARTTGVVADAAAVPSGTWVEYDVTSLVTGNGPVSFNLAPTSSDGTDVSSREATTNRPQLVVTAAGSGDPDPDTTPPAVTSTTPTDGATGIGVGTAVTATFSEAMDPGTVNGTTLRLATTAGGAAVAAAVTYNGASRTATLTPSAPLAAGTAYTATATTGLQDAAHNAMAAEHTWSFTTAEAPPPPTGEVTRQSTATKVNTTTSAQITIERPQGTVAGDVLVSCIATNGANVTASGAPTGWTRVAAVTTVSNPRVYGYYRVATAAEPASYTWALSKSVASSGGIARYAGVDTSTPVGPGVQTASGAAATSGAVPGVTTVDPGSMVVGCMATNTSATTVTMTSPAGLTEAWDLGGKRQDYADGVQATAGPSGTKTWTFSASRAWAGWLLSLRPAP
jgi:myo-inositol-hexaphosphate 3-phosphohydrolase